MADARLQTFLAALAVRPLVMGILNLTPDSFSDGGRFEGLGAARAQATHLAEGGADILDVGAESTRPGHTPVPLEAEWARLAPVLAPLVAATPLPFSIDTYKAEIARRALAAGISVVNDIWGLQRDPAMADVVAEAQAGVVIMHNRETMDRQIDIVEDMLRFFERSLAVADRAGVQRDRVLLDPGVGFGKSGAQNLSALKATDRLKSVFGLPVLIGVSRKRLFGEMLGLSVDERLIATIAANLTTLARGANVFRVHDAAEHRAALKVFEAITNA